VDPTPDKASFGVLSSTLAGKKALVLGQGDQATTLRTLPLHQPSKDFVFIKTEMTLSSNGKIEGSSEVQSGGSFDLLARTVMASLPPGTEPQIASQLMALNGQQGTGNLRHYGSEDTDKPFKYLTYFTLPDWVQLPGPGAMAVPIGLPGLVYLADVFRPLALTERKTPLVFAGGRITEHITLKLPEGMVIQKLQAPAHFSNALSKYTSSMEQKGQALEIQRQLDVRLSAPIVSSEDYKTLRETAVQVVRNLRTQLMF